MWMYTHLSVIKPSIEHSNSTKRYMNTLIFLMGVSLFGGEG